MGMMSLKLTMVIMEIKIIMMMMMMLMLMFCPQVLVLSVTWEVEVVAHFLEMWEEVEKVSLRVDPTQHQPVQVDPDVYKQCLQ